MPELYAKIPINGFDGYTPLEIAKGLQLEFYSISRPPEVRDPRYVTEYLDGWLIHPQTGQYAIILPDVSITKHKLSNEERLITFLKTAINDTQKEAVRNYWQSNSAINIHQLYEFLFPGQTMTRAEMDAEGWFYTDLN